MKRWVTFGWFHLVKIQHFPNFELVVVSENRLNGFSIHIVNVPISICRLLIYVTWCYCFNYYIIWQKQTKLAQDENQMLENMLRTLLQELVVCCFSSIYFLCIVCFFT